MSLVLFIIAWSKSKSFSTFLGKIASVKSPSGWVSYPIPTWHDITQNPGCSEGKEVKRKNGNHLTDLQDVFFSDRNEKSALLSKLIFFTNVLSFSASQVMTQPVRHSASENSVKSSLPDLIILRQFEFSPLKIPVLAIYDTAVPEVCSVAQSKIEYLLLLMTTELSPPGQVVPEERIS